MECDLLVAGIPRSGSTAVARMLHGGRQVFLIEPRLHRRRGRWPPRKGGDRVGIKEVNHLAIEAALTLRPNHVLVLVRNPMHAILSHNEAKYQQGLRKWKSMDSQMVGIEATGEVLMRLVDEGHPFVRYEDWTSNLASLRSVLLPWGWQLESSPDFSAICPNRTYEVERHGGGVTSRSVRLRAHQLAKGGEDLDDFRRRMLPFLERFGYE